MAFKKIIVQWSAGMNNPSVPQILKDYCKALADVPPSYEYFLGDPEYDVNTLHSSAGFRDAFARLDVVQVGPLAKLGAKFSELVVMWGTARQHEISDDGLQWKDSPGLALKYEVTYTPARGEPSMVFMGIRFEK